MIRITFRSVRTGEEDRLRAWLAQLNTRRDEVRETFRREGVRHEAAYLLETPDGLVLVYAVEAMDFAQAHRAYATSPLSIDHEHRAVLDATLSEKVPAHLAYYCDLPAED
jgi:hypothetical protein